MDSTERTHRQSQPPRFANVQQPPRFDLWPLALRSAMLQRGALVSCGPGLRGAAWPDCPSVRLASLRPSIADGLVAVHLTAAWVWGAVASPGPTLCIASQAGRRPSQRPTPGISRFEFRFKQHEIIRFGSLGVSSRFRTLLDLLYTPGPFECTERFACRMLLNQMHETTSLLEQHIAQHPRPLSKLAAQRVARLAHLHLDST